MGAIERVKRETDGAADHAHQRIGHDPDDRDECRDEEILDSMLHDSVLRLEAAARDSRRARGPKAAR